MATVIAQPEPAAPPRMPTWPETVSFWPTRPHVFQRGDVVMRQSDGMEGRCLVARTHFADIAWPDGSVQEIARRFIVVEPAEVPYEDED